MDFEQIKQKIASIKTTSSTTHYKVSIAALCDVVLELAKKIEKIHNPPLVKLTQISDQNPSVKTGLERKRPKPMEVEPGDIHNTKKYGSSHPYRSKDINDTKEN